MCDARPAQTAGAPAFLKRLLKSKKPKIQMSPSPVSPDVPKNTLEYQQYMKKLTERTRRKLNANGTRVKIQEPAKPRVISAETMKRIERALSGAPPSPPPPPPITVHDIVIKMKEHYKKHGRPTTRAGVYEGLYKYKADEFKELTSPNYVKSGYDLKTELKKAKSKANKSNSKSASKSKSASASKSATKGATKGATKSKSATKKKVLFAV